MGEQIRYCDMCSQPVGEILYDAATRPYGQWAWLCGDCFNRLGYGLGIGRGQKFQVLPDGKLKKLEG